VVKEIMGGSDLGWEPSTCMEAELFPCQKSNRSSTSRAEDKAEACDPADEVVTWWGMMCATQLPILSPH
jgi:hypothetical protein